MRSALVSEGYELLRHGAALETTRADINAAAQAQEAGEERLISLSRTGVRLNARHLAELRTAIEELKG